MAYAFAQMELNLIAVPSMTTFSGLTVIVPAIIGAFYRRWGAGALGRVIGGGLFVLLCTWTVARRWASRPVSGTCRSRTCCSSASAC
jgi:hypothetical protein